MTLHKSPSKTIHEHCHYCVQSRSDSEVENCTGHIVYATGKPCPFYEYRTGGRRPSVKLFRQFCLECMGGSMVAVRECSTTDCLIFPYRFGKNPARTRKGQAVGGVVAGFATRHTVKGVFPVKFERMGGRP